MKQNVEYRQQGRALTKGKILNIFLISLVFSFLTGLISGLSSGFAPTLDPETFVVINPGNPLLNFVFSLLAFAVSGYVVYGMTKVFITVSKNESPNLEKALVSSVKEQPIKAPLFAFVQGALLALWSFLFIIPGIIKSYSYALTTFILVNEPEIDAVAAITKSRQLMDGKKMQLFLLDLSYVGWYLLSLFTLGILTIWVASWHQTARTLFYQDAYQVQAR